jgi:hypothetical protein
VASGGDRINEIVAEWHYLGVHMAQIEKRITERDRKYHTGSTNYLAEKSIGKGRIFAVSV